MAYQLGFIGAGNMAEAIVRAGIDRGVVKPGQVIACDTAAARREAFASLGVAVTDDAGDVISQARQVMLAVKPQTFEALRPALRKVDASRQVVISIMAGVRIAAIEAAIGRTDGGGARVVRVMPNTPLMAGCGMAGVALGPNAKTGDELLVLQLLRAAGEAVMVSESTLDAVTAVSGSGPAYVFYLAEAMQAAAEELGLGEQSALFVRQTILGAAKLMVESGERPGELRRKVTSPGGTTAAALGVMEGRKMNETIVEAMVAARDRSVELGSDVAT